MALFSPQEEGEWKPTISNPECLKETLLGFTNITQNTTRNHSDRNRTETEVRNIIQDLLGASFPKCRPPWLLNPTTGRRLELDMFNEKLKLAFEYDGAQHDVYTPHFHINEAHFEYRKLLDRLKTELCHQHGVRLVRISWEAVRADPSQVGLLRTVVRTLQEADPPLLAPQILGDGSIRQ